MIEGRQLSASLPVARRTVLRSRPGARTLAGIVAVLVACLFIAVAGTAAQAATRPAITSWSPNPISISGSQTIAFNGTGFGTGGPAGFTGDSSIFEFQDLTQGWNAGDSNISTTITVQFGSWSDTQVVIHGFAGAYGQGSFVLKAGDKVSVAFENPQSGLWGSATATVGAPGTGLPAMPTPATSANFIGCSSSWYVSGNGAPNLWSAISSQHCVYSHPTSGWPVSANVAVFLQFGSYGDGCVPNTAGTGSMPYYFGCASQSWGSALLKTLSTDWHATFPAKHLFLIAVTNNQANGGYAGGQGWASLVNGVDDANRSAGITNVVVLGGSDIEDWCDVGCGSDVSPQSAIDWQNGYLSIGHFPVVNDDFLDCQVSSGSQPGNYCGAPGWYVSSYAQLFGSRANSAEPNAQYTTPMGPVINFPQFYSTWMADQWAGLKAALHSWGGSYAGTYGTPAIVGAMTEVNSAYENGLCNVWWPNYAWAYAQNTDGIPTAFVTDIGWESSYTANSCG